MKYIVYLTTNLKSSYKNLNKIYVGVHQTENPEIFDGYIGCGIYVNQPSTYMYPKTPFQYAVKKYGPNAFKRNILYTYDSKEEAYAKEAEIVNINFIKQAHVYNCCLGGITGNSGKPLYQFDLEGNLKKVWDYAIEAYEFYGYSKERFSQAINYKRQFLDCYWSREDHINVNDYLTTKWGQPKITYLYSKEGKLLGEFYSEKECAAYIHISEINVNKAITQNSLLAKEYYVSNTLVDEFKPKARKEWSKYTYYVYDVNNHYYGNFKGKALMPIIDLHSWGDIKDIFRYNHGWYKDFYISLKAIEEVPEKKLGHGNGITIDVYTKYGEFIETLPSVKEVKEKYKVRACDVKNIMKGDKYVKDWIFKYHSPKQ